MSICAFVSEVILRELMIIDLKENDKEQNLRWTKKNVILYKSHFQFYAKEDLLDLGLTKVVRNLDEVEGAEERFFTKGIKDCTISVIKGL